MHKNIVYFNHGKESGPWGIKISRLAEVAKDCGFAVESPDYQFTFDPLARIQHLLDLKPQASNKLVLMGSSMGGYVAAQACAAIKPDALFLIAPALYFPEYESEPQDCPSDTVVTHGWHDDIVPIERSIRFSQSRSAALHIFNSDHTLNDQLDALSSLFEQQLLRILNTN